MIASVRGTVLRAGLDSVVVEVGGVGMLVHTTPRTAAGMRTGQSASLATSMVVREESLTLYGFADEDERVVFELLQTASGVGPRLAQAMLAVHDPDTLRRAVASEDLATLMLVPGIGRKGAQRIVLELKDRLGAVRGTSAGPGDRGSSSAGWREPLHTALLGLGWSAREADEAVATTAPLADDAVANGTEPDIALLLRSALRSLSRA